MADYQCNGTQTVNAPTDSTLSLESLTGRFRIFEFSTGFTLASPSDNLLTVTAQRTSADGTAGSTPIPAPLDPADGACTAVCQTNHSAEPTYTSAEEVFGPIGMHMRATYRWVAAPGKEIVVSDAANVGVGWFAAHASVTPEHTLMAYFSE